MPFFNFQFFNRGNIQGTSSFKICLLFVYVWSMFCVGTGFVVLTSPPHPPSHTHCVRDLFFWTNYFPLVNCHAVANSTVICQQVYVEPLLRDDLIFICSTMYPSIPPAVLTQMVDFNMKVLWFCPLPLPPPAVRCGLEGCHPDVISYFAVSKEEEEDKL